MTGERASFVELNEGVRGTVKFGNGSVVQIMWRGTITLSIGGGLQRAFWDVYYIPRLGCSVVSRGQLDEHACDVRIKHGVLPIRDPRQVRQPHRQGKACTKSPLQTHHSTCVARVPSYVP
jgi:hypothetical protein